MVRRDTKILQTSQQVLTNISESADTEKDTIALIENINYIKDTEGRSKKDKQNIIRYLLVLSKKMTVEDFIDKISDLGIISCRGSRPYATPLTQCGWIRYFNQCKDDVVSHVYRGIAHMRSHGSRDLDSLILNHAIETTNEKDLESLCEDLSNAKLLFSVISDPQFIKVCDEKTREIIHLFLEQKFKWRFINRSLQPEQLFITYS